MVELYNMDCMKAMAEMPDNCFDLAIVDPPYGIGIDGQKKFTSKVNKKHNRKFHKKKGWDTAAPEKEYFEELRRISKHQIIFGANYFCEHLPPSKGWIIWDKGQYGLTMSDCELAYSSFNKPTRIYKCNRVHILLDGSIHPTQKPVSLYTWILDKYAQKGWSILDTHLGSGSSAVAAHDMGYDFVGYELDKEYFEAAQQRLHRHQRQLKLFVS